MAWRSTRSPDSRQQVGYRDPPDLLAVQLHRDRVSFAIGVADRITGRLPLAERPGADLDDPAVEVDDPVDRDAEGRISPQLRPAVPRIGRIGDLDQQRDVAGAGQSRTVDRFRTTEDDDIRNRQ